LSQIVQWTGLFLAALAGLGVLGILTWLRLGKLGEGSGWPATTRAVLWTLLGVSLVFGAAMIASVGFLHHAG
jgi:hypothetical protein